MMTCERPEEVRLLEPLLPQPKPFEEVPAVTDRQFTLEEIEREEWRDVVGYEGWYAVSNLGRVRRTRTNCGTFGGRMLSPQRRKEGFAYLKVSLSRNNAVRQLALHRVVVEAFVRPLTAGDEQVNHIDGNPANNRAVNLEICTAKENTNHAWEVLGKHKRGSSNGRAQVNEMTVVAIKQHLAAGLGPLLTAKLLGVSIHIVADISRGKTWRHVTTSPRSSPR